MASSAFPQYTVFISHAGEDKATIAMPLREKLKAHNITAFVDEADIPRGDIAANVMISAMENAKVAVVVLSPEFVARKWPMKELLCFLRRREETSGEVRCPVIIPFFYRLSISELYKEPGFDRKDKNGKSLYLASRFLERMNAGEPEANIDIIKPALQKLHSIMGVRNDLNASNDFAYEMSVRRDFLLCQLCEEVRKVLKREAAETTTNLRRQQPEIETYCRHFDAPDSSTELVFNFFNKVGTGYSDTLEGRILKELVHESSDTHRAIAVRGIAGVGKSSLMRGLSCLAKVKLRFKDGIYHLPIGMDATKRDLIEALSKAVQKAGGREIGNVMRTKNDLPEVMGSFGQWFAEKQCLFIIDDVWMSREVPSGVVEELLKQGRSGRDCKLLLTTRSDEVASRADIFFALEPRSPVSLESRAILFRYSGLTPGKGNDADERAVDKVLERCSGLPLFLGIAGKAVKALGLRRSDGCAAYHAYAENLVRVGVHGLLHTDVGWYKQLAERLMVSINLLEERKNQSGVPPFRLTIAKMHRRLSVLERNFRVPMSMLRFLWEVESEAHAAFVAQQFEEIGLADLEFKRTASGCDQLLRLHDSVYEFAVEETRKNLEEKIGHETILRGYSREIEENHGYFVWWSATLEPDGYIHEHLCRNLVGAGRHGELVQLLFRPEWIARAVTIRGAGDVERDFLLGMSVLRTLRRELADNTSLSAQASDKGHVRIYYEKMESLWLVSEALKLSSLCLEGNPGQIWFHMHGRLIPHKQRFDEIRKYVDRIEKKGPKPLLLSINPFLTSPGDADSCMSEESVHCTTVMEKWDSVYCIAVMADGERVVCGCDDGGIDIVNLIRSTKIESEWRAHDQGVLAISIGSDEKRLVSGSMDRTAKVWDMQTKALIATFRHHTDRLTCVAMMKDGKIIVSGSADGTAQVWDAETGSPVAQPFRGHNGWVRCLAPFPDGEHVATGGDDRTVRFWNVTSGAQLAFAFAGQGGSVYSVAVAIDARRIVIGSEDGTLRIWDVAMGSQIGDTLKGHKKCVNSVVVSTDVDRVLSASDDGTIRVWDVQSGHEAYEPLEGHKSEVKDVSFLPYGNSVVSCSEDCTVRVWDLPRQQVERVVDRHEEAVTSVSFTPDGTRVVSGSEDEAMRIWDATTGQQLGDPLLGHFAFVSGVEVTRDGRYVLSVSHDRTVRAWDLESRICLRQLSGHNGMLLCVALTSDNRAVTGSTDKTVSVWDLTAPDGSYFVLGIHSASVRRVFISGDGFRVISVASDGVIMVWDLHLRQPLKQMKKKYAWQLGKRQIMALVGEAMLYDDVPLTIPLGRDELSYSDISYGEEQSAQVLATLDFEVRAWALSPNKRTLCLGLENGIVAFMRLNI